MPTINSSPPGSPTNPYDVKGVASPADLLRLVGLVAGKDRPAFKVLYELTSPAVLAEVRSTILDPADGAAVTAATFVEVWALARYHADPDSDIYAWMVGIATRRIADRWPAESGEPPVRGSAGSSAPRREMWWAMVAASYDRQAELSLASLLRP